MPSSTSQWHIKTEKNQAYVYRSDVRLHDKNGEFKNILSLEFENHLGETCIKVRSLTSHAVSL